MDEIERERSWCHECGREEPSADRNYTDEKLLGAWPAKSRVCRRRLT